MPATSSDALVDVAAAAEACSRRGRRVEPKLASDAPSRARSSTRSRLPRSPPSSTRTPPVRSSQPARHGSGMSSCPGRWQRLGRRGALRHPRNRRRVPRAGTLAPTATRSLKPSRASRLHDRPTGIVVRLLPSRPRLRMLPLPSAIKRSVGQPGLNDRPWARPLGGPFR